MPNCYRSSFAESFSQRTKILYDRYHGEFKDRMVINLGDGVCMNSNSYRALSNLTLVPLLGLVGLEKNDPALANQKDTLDHDRRENIRHRRNAWMNKQLRKRYKDEMGKYIIPGGRVDWEAVELRVLQAQEKEAQEEHSGSDDSESSDGSEYLTDEDIDDEEREDPQSSWNKTGVSRKERERWERISVEDAPANGVFVRQIWYDLNQFSFAEINQMKWAQHYVDEPRNLPSAFKEHAHLYLLVRVLERARANVDSGLYREKKRTLRFNGSTYVSELKVNDLTDERNLEMLKSAVAKQILDHSPKLKFLLRWALEATARKEKGTIWVMWPSLQVFVHAFLKLFDLASEPYLAELDQAERDEVVKALNQKKPPPPRPSSKRSKILPFVNFAILPFAVGGVGLNLQKACANAIGLDPVPNKAVQDQIIGRHFRFGQDHHVYAYEIWIKDSFDERANNTALQKAVPQIMAMLDQGALANAVGIDLENAAQETVMQVKDLKGFHMKDGSSFEIEHVSRFQDGVPAGWTYLTPQDLLKVLFQHLLGEAVDLSSLQEEDEEADEFVASIMAQKVKDSEAAKEAAKAERKKARDAKKARDKESGKGAGKKAKGPKADRPAPIKIWNGAAQKEFDIYAPKTTAQTLKSILEEKGIGFKQDNGKDMVKADLVKLWKEWHDLSQTIQ